MIIKGEKKLIPLSINIVEKASQIAKRKMSSLSRFVEDAVKHAIKLEEELGFNLDYSYSILKAVKTLKVLGGVFIPQPVLECLVDENCRFNKEKILEKWFESGKLYGVYLKDSDNKAQILQAFFEISRWNFNEVRISNESSNYKIKCVATSITSEETEYIIKFLEGLITGLMCSLSHLEYIKGLIIAEFKC